MIEIICGEQFYSTYTYTQRFTCKVRVIFNQKKFDIVCTRPDQISDGDKTKILYIQPLKIEL